MEHDPASMKGVGMWNMTLQVLRVATESIKPDPDRKAQSLRSHTPLSLDYTLIVSK